MYTQPKHLTTYLIKKAPTLKQVLLRISLQIQTSFHGHIQAHLKDFLGQFSNFVLLLLKEKSITSIALFILRFKNLFLFLMF